MKDASPNSKRTLVATCVLVNTAFVIGDMDETPAFFDMILAKFIYKKECVVWTSACEKKHVTIVLSATADGKMVHPMIIFKGATDKTIQKNCTSKWQPMEVWINKSFKAILRKCWVENVSEMTNKEHIQLPPPIVQDMVDWAKKAFNYISSDSQMVSRSFDVCGITATDSSKVRSWSFNKSCLGFCKSCMENDEEEDFLVLSFYTVMPSKKNKLRFNRGKLSKLMSN